MGRDYAYCSLLGAIVRQPEAQTTTNGKPYLDVVVSGEMPSEDKSIPWYMTVRLAGGWLKCTPQLMGGVVVLVTGTLEQWAVEHGTATRVIPDRFEFIQGYPAAMMLEDKSGGYRFPGGINHATLIGNLTRDSQQLEIKGQHVTKLSLAVSPNPEAPIYAQLDLWNSPGQPLKRGARLMATGAISLDRWIDAAGKARSSLTLDCSRIEELERIGAPSAQDPFQNDPVLGQM
jgi:single-stranded DNA-binding protein